jgi:hypothetical protein
VPHGPEWCITVQSGASRSRVVPHGPEWCLTVQSGASRSRVVSGAARSRVMPHGPEWCLTVQSGASLQMRVTPPSCRFGINTARPASVRPGRVPNRPSEEFPHQTWAWNGLGVRDASRQSARTGRGPTKPGRGSELHIQSGQTVKPARYGLYYGKCELEMTHRGPGQDRRASDGYGTVLIGKSNFRSVKMNGRSRGVTGGPSSPFMERPNQADCYYCKCGLERTHQDPGQDRRASDRPGTVLIGKSNFRSVKMNGRSLGVTGGPSSPFMERPNQADCYYCHL